MFSSKYATILLFGTALAEAPQPATSQPRTSMSCNQATKIEPQVGAAYKGDVLVDDYKLRAHVPNELTGWGGAATNAPFHGFTIFFDPSMQSCIIFEIHLRIDDDEAPRRPHTAKLLSLGNAKAWQMSNGNGSRQRGLINVTTYFSFHQDRQTDDGKILLISPPEELQKTRAIYDTFVKSVLFGTQTR